MGEPRLRFLQGDLTEQITGQYDIVASNIVADAIVSLAARVPAHLKPGGVWISSGIIDTREDDVREALARTGFQLCDRTEADGWICIAARSLPC
jgi:ribosomal protein L11 methyltransferase